jgi:hypothetical protein
MKIFPAFRRKRETDIKGAERRLKGKESKERE